jgi:hypothetical protein
MFFLNALVVEAADSSILDFTSLLGGGGCFFLILLVDFCFYLKIYSVVSYVRAGGSFEFRLTSSFGVRLLFFYSNFQVGIL